jgi:hypothetical protein
MSGPLTLRGRVIITDGATPTLKKIEHALASLGRMTGRQGGLLSGSARGTPAGALGFGMTAFGFTALIGATRQWNDALWGANAALLANKEIQDKVAAGDMPGAINLAKVQTGEMANEAMRLSREMKLLPELFAKAGMEATKMGLSYQESQAIMRAAGAVFMSDKDADPSDIAKALGTYGLLYGKESDPDAYAKQVYDRASQLSLAGAKTRTSASAIEGGARNYMGIHGAFGGRFEDLIALIAMGSQAGQFEKETGTSLKSLQARFLRMPASGYAAMAGSGIDIRNFMDFGAVDPTRATNAIIQSFPQQLGKGARGSLLKFLEKAQRDGRLGNPEIIAETMAHLEKNGLEFAGDEDRDAAFNKLGALMSGVGGKFDPIGLLSEVSKAVEEGRASPGILGIIGEGKRVHQYAALLKLFPEMLKLRDELLADDGNYLKSVEAAFPDSQAGRVEALGAAFQRLQVAIMSNEGLLTFVTGLERVFEWASKLPPELTALALGAVAARAAFGGLAWVFGGAVSAAIGIVGGFARIRGALAMFSGFGAAAAAGAPLLAFLSKLATAASTAAKGVGAVGKLAGLGGLGAIWGGAKALGRMGLRFIPGVGLVLAGVGAGWAAWDAYSRGEDTGEILKHGTLGALGLDVGDAEAEGAPAGDWRSGARYQPDDGPSKFDAENLSRIAAEAEAAGQRIRSALAIDLSAEGRRAMETFAAGITAGGAAAVAAAEGVAARVKAAGAGVRLNTGPAMAPAR